LYKDSNLMWQMGGKIHKYIILKTKAVEIIRRIAKEGRRPENSLVDG